MQMCFFCFLRALRVFLSSLLVGGLASVFVLTGCIPSVENVQRDWVNRIFRPYVPDVVQGNFISSEQFAKLQLGLTREQVQQIMGTSLLADYFHANRWDYVFEFKREGQKISQERLVTIIFADNKVIKFEGNALPTETELVAEIDNYAKRKRTFWQYLFGDAQLLHLQILRHDHSPDKLNGRDGCPRLIHKWRGYHLCSIQNGYVIRGQLVQIGLRPGRR